MDNMEHYEPITKIEIELRALAHAQQAAAITAHDEPTEANVAFFQILDTRLRALIIKFGRAKEVLNSQIKNDVIKSLALDAMEDSKR